AVDGVVETGLRGIQFAPLPQPWHRPGRRGCCRRRPCQRVDGAAIPQQLLLHRQTQVAFAGEAIGDLVRLLRAYLALVESLGDVEEGAAPGQDAAPCGCHHHVADLRRPAARAVAPRPAYPWPAD